MAGEESGMEQERHIHTDDARSGVTQHNVRYVLGISLTLTILVMMAIYVWGVA